MKNNAKGRYTKVIFFALLLLVFIGSILAALFLKESDNNSTLIVRSIPQFSLMTLDSPEISLDESLFNQEDYQLLNVWASWCSVCKSEHSLLLDIAQKGVPIIGLNYRDSREAALHYLQEEGTPFKRVLFDPKGEFALDLGVIGTPETYLVNRQADIIIKHSGKLTTTVWEEKFKPYLTKTE